MTERPLRRDQAEMIERIRESFKAGFSRPCVQYPTGGGKTRIISEVSKMAIEKGNKPVLFAPRRELIRQGSVDLKSEGMNPSIIMAGYSQERICDSYVASFDTVNSRVVRRETMKMPPVQLAHIDEAHLSVTDSRIEVMNRLRCRTIGYTATPARSDGRGLGIFYDDLLIGPSPLDLIEAGVLVPPVYYGCPADIDFSQLSYTGTDYTEEALVSLESEKALIGDVVTNWELRARDRQTVVFACTSKHSLNLAREFQAKGYKAAHLDYKTPEAERLSIMEKLKNKEIQILCNIFIASYGLDVPSLSCAVIARPIKNISLWLQTIGRVLRVDRFDDTKTDALIIDHVQGIQDNGFAEDPQPWDLHGSTTVRERKEAIQRKEGHAKEITCDNCSKVFKGQRSCPYCGHQMIQQDEPIPAFEVELVPMTRATSKEQDLRNKLMSPAEKNEVYAQLKYIAKQNFYKDGWIKNKYRMIFGVWPNKIDRDLEPLSPTPEIQRLIRNSHERFRKKAVKRRDQETLLSSSV